MTASSEIEWGRGRRSAGLAAVCVLLLAGCVWAQVQEPGGDDMTAKPKDGKTFDPVLSTKVPPTLADLPLFGAIEWRTTKLPWVADGPYAGISGVGMVAVDGRIYVAGGFIPGGDGSEDAASHRTSRWTWRYDPAEDAWEQLPDAPIRREYVRAIAAGNRIYLVGGACQYKGQEPPYRPHADCVVLDLAADPPVWRAGSALNVARTHMAVGYAGHYLVVAGGNEYDFTEKGYSRETISATTEVFDLNQPGKGWQLRTPIPGPGRGWSAFVSANDRLYLLSGITWNASNEIVPTRESLRYDPATDTWDRLAPPPIALTGWDGALYADRYVICIAGVVRHETDPSVPIIWSDLVTAYDIQEDEWLRVEGLLPPGAVFNDPGVAVIRDTIYVLGAEGPDGSHYNYFLIGRIKPAGRG